VRGGGGAGWYALHASNYQTDGFDACRGDLSAGCFADEPDDDGYENTSASIRAGGQLTDELSLEGGILNSDSETEFDGSFQNNAESLTRITHIKANASITDSWQASLLVAQSKDESENFLNDTFASRFDTSRDQVSFQNNISVQNSRLILGVDYIDDEIDSSTSFTETSRDNTGIFASFDTRIAENDIELSLREDDNQQFGSETTGGIAFGREMAGGTRATISYGTAFKAPTFNELYFPDFGNPDLTAETSESIDLGLSGSNGDRRWSINIFQSTIEDLIGFDPVTFLPVNIDEAEITGIEFASSLALGDWSLSGNLTLQDPKDTSGGIHDGNQLARRAKQLFNLSIDRDFGKWSAGIGVLYNGKAYDDLANQNELDGYTVVDLHGGYRFSPKWSLGIKINNAFDEEYETAQFYNQDGVNALATLRYIPR